MAPATPSLINPSLRTNGGDDGAAGALASATSAEKNQGSRAPRGPKVSNNFVPTRRNRGAKIDGGVAEAEAAGGSPRKKPRGPSPRKKLRGEETFLLRLDRAKATAERGRTKSIGLEDPQGDPKAIRTIGPRPAACPKAAAPRKRPPGRRSPPLSPRRTPGLAISTQRRRSPTTTTTTTTTTMDPSVAPSRTIGPTAVEVEGISKFLLHYLKLQLQVTKVTAIYTG